MAFPSSPLDGATTTINGITYVYSSTLGAWSIQSSSTSAPSISTTNITLTGNLSATGNVTASGNLSGVLVAGTLSTAAQPNITSTGTLTSLTVTGNVSSGNLIATGTTSTPSISNGNSSVAIAANANVTLTVTSTLIGTISTSGAQLTSLGINTAPSGVAGEIRATANITAGYSDLRLKTDIQPIVSALDKIEQLSGFLYTQNQLAEQFGYNDYSRQVGVSAQAVQEVQPEAVRPAPFDTDSEGRSISGDNYLTVAYERLVPLLIEGIKELRAEVNRLKGAE